MASSSRKVRSVVVGVALSSFPSFVFDIELKILVPLCFLLVLISELAEVSQSGFLSFVFYFELKGLVPLFFLLAPISEVFALKHPLTGDITIWVETWLVGAAAVTGICSLKVSS